MASQHDVNCQCRDCWTERLAGNTQPTNGNSHGVTLTLTEQLVPPDERERQSLTIVPFLKDIQEIPALKYYGLRALCGAIMNRHIACLSPHPFCGPRETVLQTIAHVVPQYDNDMTPVLAIYLSGAMSDGKFSEANPASTEAELVEYAARLTYEWSVPSLKMVIRQLNNGSYIAQFSSIVNPIEYNFVAGMMDTSNVRLLYCDPEPKHVTHIYYDNDISIGQTVIPEYHCFKFRDQWWIVDVDRTRGVYAEVAGLAFTNNPEHNYGIHRPNAPLYINPVDGSEWSKIISENQRRILSIPDSAAPNPIAYIEPAAYVLDALGADVPREDILNGLLLGMFSTPGWPLESYPEDYLQFINNVESGAILPTMEIGFAYTQQRKHSPLSALVRGIKSLLGMTKS